MHKRTIGIGIMAVALILAISMTASANPDPTGATPTTVYNNVTLGTFTAGEAYPDAYTDTNELGEGVNTIYINVTAATSTLGTLNISYICENGSTATIESGDITDGSQVSTWFTVTGVGDLVDVTNVSSGTITEGTFVIVANVSRQALYQGVGGTDVAKGGFVTEMNLDGTSRTTRWQGYYGNVSGSIALKDSQAHTMFSWAWDASKGGEVIATTNTSIPPWTGFHSVDDSSTVTSLNTIWSWAASATDSANATLNTTLENVIIADTTYTINATTAGALQPTASQWQCGAIATENPVGTDDFIFVGIINATTTSFDTTAKDYEMIVPTYDNGATLTYYFYVEMS